LRLAATSPVFPEASTYRWPRLAACLLFSAALHLAMIAQAPRPRPVEAPAPLFVRLVAQPAPEVEPPRISRSRRPPQRGEDRPLASSKSAPPRRGPVASVEPPQGGPAQVRERTAFPWAYEAYSEFGEDVQQDTLTQAQLRVPRGNALERSPEPIQPIVPRYPAETLNRGIRGRVLLEAFIDAGGAVDEVVVINDEGKPELAAAAVQAVRRTWFRPAEGPNGPTRSRVTLRVLFNFE
jgi:TonB family protein